MTDYFFTRHGESQANVDQIFAGWMDSPLTEKGRIEAEAEGKRLAKEGMSFDVIISSPLSRAHDTAMLVAKAVGYPVDAIVLLDELKERGAGKYEGMPTSSLDNQLEDSDPIAAAGGESFEEFAKRVSSALDVMRSKSAGHGSVLIVAHAGWYKMATTLLEQTDITQFFMRPSPQNNSVIRFAL